MTPRSVVWLALACCSGNADGTSATVEAAEVVPAALASVGDGATTRTEAIGAEVIGAVPVPAPAVAISSAQFAELFQRLSEPSRGFYGDNYVSNETSYLHVAADLERAAVDAAYVGVGPEQNLSYIALTRPRLAFIVDIRRDNALLHLLYKALFELADTRADFLALLLGREPVSASTVGLSVVALVDQVEAMPRDRDRHRRTGRRIVRLLTRQLELGLCAADLTRIEEIHQAFFEHQLDLKFEWHKDNGRDYPTLRELLLATTRDGTMRGFLASQTSFGFVRQLHRQHRIIPVVGDFAGEHALRAIAAELAKRAIPLAVFYVSNVEQYLVKSRSQWKAWRRNIGGFAITDDAVFVRSYLAGAKQHPAQMADHRTATLLQPIASMLAREGYESFWELTTETSATASAAD